MTTKFRSMVFVCGISQNQAKLCHFSDIAAQLYGWLLLNYFCLLRCWVVNLNTIWSTLQTNFMFNFCDFDSECYSFCILQCCVVNLNTIWSILKRNFIVKFCEFDFHCFLEKKDKVVAMSACLCQIYITSTSNYDKIVVVRLTGPSNILFARCWRADFSN